MTICTPVLADRGFFAQSTGIPQHNRANRPEKTVLSAERDELDKILTGISRGICVILSNFYENIRRIYKIININPDGIERFIK